MYEEWNQRALKLGETRVWRTYCGGKHIERFHGRPGDSSASQGNFPEDWVGSCVSARNPGREELCEGLSLVTSLSQEVSLAEMLQAQPENYYGKKHLEHLGENLAVLIKLIDAGERLTVQVHPDKKFAKEEFHSDFGKTESWYILSADEDACVYFGFKEGVTREKWKEIFQAQDIEAMLSCLHKIPVKAGDSFFIPGGLPHAIGKGCFLAEVQEPTDYTMRTELVTPGGLKIHENQCHQGLGYEKMLDCFHYEGMSLEDTCEKWMVRPEVQTLPEGGSITSLVDSRFTNLFSMSLLEGSMDIPQGEFLKLWIVYAGKGTLSTEGEDISLAQGDFLLLPASMPKARLISQDLTIIQCQSQTTFA